MMKIYLSNLVPSPTVGSYCIKGNTLYVAKAEAGTGYQRWVWAPVGSDISSSPTPPVLIVENV